MATSATNRAEFTTSVEEVEPRLSFALAAAYGPEVGREATADAQTYAWEPWEGISTMDNAAGGAVSGSAHKATVSARQARNTALRRRRIGSTPVLPSIAR